MANQLFASLTVVRGSGDLKRLKAYLYDHTTLVAWETDTDVYGERVQAMLVTTSVESQGHADWLADYQRGRLASGLYGAQPAEMSVDRVW